VVTVMENYELSSEILAKGHKYYIQTALVASQHQIVTSLFHEGKLLSKQVETYNSSKLAEEVQILVRQNHDERIIRIRSLLEVSQKLIRMEDPRAHLKLGEALYNQCLIKEAMAEVVRAIKLNVNDSKAFSILGSCLLTLEDYDRAIRAFRHGIELSPNYPDLHNDLGRAYLSLKQCSQAVKSFERAIELNNYYVEAIFNLAEALCQNVVDKEDFELSRKLPHKLVQSLERVIQMKPALDTPEFREAVVAANNEDYEAVFKTLVRIREESAKIHTSNLSLDLYLILKFDSDNLTEEDIDRYIAKTMRALETNPNYPDLRNDLGILYTTKCKLFIDKANSAFREALKMNRDFKKAEKNLKLSENDRQGIHLLLKALLD
jgi:tetratricopeptide (TPR) repeat protein